ncbi:hypothetical protein GCM10017752_17210 [Streptomyces roseoviridis]
MAARREGELQPREIEDVGIHAASVGVRPGAGRRPPVDTGPTPAVAPAPARVPRKLRPAGPAP